MTVEIKYTFENAGEAAAFLLSVEKTIASAGKAAPAPKPARTEAAAGSPPSATPTPAPTAAPAPAPTPAADPAADYMKSGLPELTQQAVAKDRAAVVAVLAEFKAKKAAELKPDQWDAYRAKVQAILTPAEDLT